MKIPVLQKRNRIILGMLGAGAVCFLYFSHLANSADTQKTFLAKTEEPVPGLMINEVCCVNPGTAEGDIITYEDYIELYNPTDMAISLDGFYLSDSMESLYDYPLPSDLTVNPDSYVLFYASDSKENIPEGCLSLPFCLSSEGETIFLSYRNDTSTLIADSVQFPSPKAGTVYARDAKEDQAFTAMRPSPGKPNSSDTRLLASPVFSAPSGFYEGSLLLSLEGPNNASIYYTLDGSDPTKDSILYTGPISLKDPSSQENLYASKTDITAGMETYIAPSSPVDKAVVIRAAAFAKDGSSSDPVTATYFFDFETKSGYQNAAVLSIVTDPANLFDSESGIYVLGNPYEEGIKNGEIASDFSWLSLLGYTNYFESGPETERIAYMELFDTSHQLSLDQTCGIRIRGNESRSFPQKSFTLFSRNRYETEYFDPVLFDSGISYPDLILNGAKRLKKVIFFPILKDRSPAVQRYQPCQVFLNGEYWGMYYLMEKYSTEFLEGYYGVTPESTLLIKDSWEIQDGDESEIYRFDSLLEALDQDLSDPTLYDALTRQMDMQNYLDWLCANIYLANTDTQPLGNNVFTWQSLRSTGNPLYEDGRWRWIFYDLDDSLGAALSEEDGPAYAFDSLDGYLTAPPTPSLMKSGAFRQQFVITFLDIANETFRFERVSPLLDQVLEDYSPWMELHDSRWNISGTDASLAEQVEDLRTFFQFRYDAIVPLLAEYFDLKGDLCTLTLENETTEWGTLELNTICPELENGYWTGCYYSDYPITLTALPSDGHTFTGWEISGASLLEGNASDEEIVLLLEDTDITIKALFD